MPISTMAPAVVAPWSPCSQPASSLCDALVCHSSSGFICREKPVAPSTMLSMAQLRTLALADQIKILMKNGMQSDINVKNCTSGHKWFKIVYNFI